MASGVSWLGSRAKIPRRTHRRRRPRLRTLKLKRRRRKSAGASARAATLTEFLAQFLVARATNGQAQPIVQLHFVVAAFLCVQRLHGVPAHDVAFVNTLEDGR